MLARVGTDIDTAVSLLQQGEVVAIPTETVYGLAGNACEPDALLKIFEAKNRPHFNPLIAHTNQLDKVQEFLAPIPDIAYSLAESFWPGPMTLLLKKNDQLPDLLTAGNPRVAIRVPAHPLALDLLTQLDFPLAAPSANPFGYISPTTAAHVAAQLGARIPYILDGGPCTIGIESTILGFSEEGQVIVYRIGGLALEQVEKIVGKLSILSHSGRNQPKSPGMLNSHYAPTTSLYLGDVQELLAEYGTEGTGILSFSRLIPDLPGIVQRCLAPSGQMEEAAKNLFAVMRELDRLGLKRILAEKVPEHGVGKAINDRLSRAQEKMK
ncbi:MAG: L-threonylcarbamoyladenylate synthase [Bacteroidota bacterium]